MNSTKCWNNLIIGKLSIATAISMISVVSTILITSCWNTSGDDAVNDSETIDENHATVPGMPTHVRAQNTGTAGDGNVKLIWTIPSPGNRADGTADTISNYQIYYSEIKISDVVKATQFKQSDTITTPPVTVNGFTPGKAYYFAVVANNTKGPGDEGMTSAPVKVALTGDQSSVPGIPIGLVVQNYGVDGNGQVELSWPAPSPGKIADGSADNIISYDIYYSEKVIINRDYAVTSTIKFDSTDPITGSPTIITDLKSGRVYYFCVAANNKMGAGKPALTYMKTSSSAYDMSSIPGQPDSIIAKNIGTPGDGEVELSWTAPSPGTKTDGTIDTIGSYDIYSTIDFHSLTKFLPTAPITSSPAIITGLTPGTSYKFAVIANNTVGSSMPGNTLNDLIVAGD